MTQPQQQQHHQQQRNEVSRLFCNDNLSVSDDASRSNTWQQQEQQQASDHHQQQKQKRRLEFLHIPKNAGGTIRQAAVTHGIVWGACHWVQCEQGKDGVVVVRKKFPLKDIHERPVKHPKWNVSFWHLPPQYYDATLTTTTATATVKTTINSTSSSIWASSSGEGVMVLRDDKKNKQSPSYYYSPYLNADLFIVVRHPYSRIVSQWNWMAKKDIKSNTINETRKMNAFLDEVLNEMSIWYEDDDNAREQPQPYVKHGGHFIPQAEYLNDLVTTVLRYEHLNDDFDCLLRRYDLPTTLSLRISEQVIHPHSPNSLTVNDLDASVRRKIAQVYQEDFEYFGYHAW